MYVPGERVHVSSVEYIPLLCMHIPQKHNPVLVVPVDNSKIVVKVEVTHERGLELPNVDDVLEKYLLNFYQFMCDELGVNYGFIIDIEGGFLHRGFAYVVITNIITKILAGGLTRDVREFLNMLDGKFFVSECVSALRHYDEVREAYVWRYGDEVVRLGRVHGYVKRSLSVIDPTPRINVLEDAQMVNILTHLVGITAVKACEAISAGDVGKLYDYLRLFNGLWEGMNVFREDLTHHRFKSGGNHLYVQDIGRVLFVEAELRFQDR